MGDLITELREIFGDQFRVDRELTAGGMSRVFLATDHALGRQVVIKILPPELTSELSIARFKRESGLTAHLQHPHILPVIAAGERAGLLYYIMPFISGESLRARLEHEGQLPVLDATRLVREVADALAYAHGHGVIHRDIKPENILLQGSHAVLADFGIAAALDNSPGQTSGERLTGTGMSLGTIGYMAPEQAVGEKGVDARADIYALGVVLFEALAGRPPFEGESVQEIFAAHLTERPPPLDDLRPETPPGVVAAVARALEKSPADRFQTAAELRDALEVAVQQTSSLTASFTTAFSVPRVKRMGRRLRAKAGRIAIAILLLAATGVGVAKLVARARGTVAEAPVFLAVAPFDVLTTAGDLPIWREGMVDVLAHNVDGAGPLRAVSPTLAIRRAPGRAVSDSIPAFAKRTGARYVVYGNLRGSGPDEVRSVAHLFDAVRDTTYDYEQVTAASVEQLADSLTLHLLADLGKVHRLGATRSEPLSARSIPALRAFLRGENFYRRTSWDSAGAAYVRAVELDSNFAPALRRLSLVREWQNNGHDSLMKRISLRAGRLNHALAPRESLLVAADSIRVAIDPAAPPFDLVRRLFATLDEAARRYPNDPEVWLAVGEARFHYGYGSLFGITDRSVLDAFDRSIALDSAFAPAYIHPVQLALDQRGPVASLGYARAFLALNPTDKQADAIGLDAVLLDPRESGLPATRARLDTISGTVIGKVWRALRRWPDSSETAIRLLRILQRRSARSPTYKVDSGFVRQSLPVALAYRGRLHEAYEAYGTQPGRLYSELTLLGAIPPDSASATLSGWTARGLLEMRYALPWWAERHMIAQIDSFRRIADSVAHDAKAPARRLGIYSGAAARAYALLARSDTGALAAFLTLSDTLCGTCFVDQLYLARLLARDPSRRKEALALLSLRPSTMLTPMEIPIALERGKIEELLGDRAAAARDFELVIAAWGKGDPETVPLVKEARAHLAALGAQVPSR